MAKAMSSQIVVRMDESMEERLRKEALGEKISLGEHVRQILTMYHESIDRRQN